LAIRGLSRNISSRTMPTSWIFGQSRWSLNARDSRPSLSFSDQESCSELSCSETQKQWRRCLAVIDEGGEIANGPASDFRRHLDLQGCRWDAIGPR
jgi:hypothetical protein